MFRRRPDWQRKSAPRRVAISFEGQAIEALDGDSVAAAVLSARPGFTRTTPARGGPRAPYCMMGVCFECLMEIDGVPNRQACLVQVRDGMTVRRQVGASTIHGPEDHDHGGD